MHTLKALNLAKSYQHNSIIKDVSIEIKSGEIVGLLGPNGAGKTTCFYMILGLISPDHGQILLNNENISRHPVHLRAQLGINYLPQEASIFRKLSVKDNILAILELQNSSPSAKLSDLEILLDEFDLGHIQQQYGYALSGGERRRVEIARALASKPKFLFLDEPFAGVDPLSLQDIKTLIKTLSKRGIGCLITDHNVLETLHICDKAYVINQGLIISSGLPQTIVQDPLVQKVYLGKDFRLKQD